MDVSLLAESMELNKIPTQGNWALQMVNLTTGEGVDECLTWVAKQVKEAKKAQKKWGPFLEPSRPPCSN